MIINDNYYVNLEPNLQVYTETSTELLKYASRLLKIQYCYDMFRFTAPESCCIQQKKPIWKAYRNPSIIDAFNFYSANFDNNANSSVFSGFLNIMNFDLAEISDNNVYFQPGVYF